jgi:N-acetylneuraminate synthase
MLCTSSYPAKPIDTHLARIRTLQDMFDVEVGLSDHTMGINVAIGAIALGATLIEKHVTLDRNNGGVDSAFSLEPHELSALVIAAEEVSSAIGNSYTWQKNAESESIRHRPSIYISDSVSVNQTITLENIRTVRPSGGLEPKYLEQVLGRKYSKAAKMGTPLSWDIILPLESD